MDFTIKKYEELCSAIANSTGSVTVKDYLLKRPKKFIILRHDVDRSLENALKIAIIENKLGLHASYYFRVPRTFDIKVMKKIQNLGHEIGYHYESLDKARGDYEKAIKIFQNELELFKPFNIKTICAHGNPLTKWINTSMWDIYKLRDFGLIGEAYLSFNFNKVEYFTDTGRKWKNIINSSLVKIRNTDELINKIKNSRIKKGYFLTHPCRWNDNMLLWSKELLLQSIKNIGKRFLK